ncbi:MAG TPA: sialidase family protein [Actinophytocola sp.]|uniref:sialidase family protein n=1 Tax=Actinophytocola sp. TaxID=1872138 RepID=UPI002DFDB391|nr:sialidase family protein [Actinophytocola sp.]
MAALSAALLFLAAAPAFAAPGDALVTNGSPPGPFSQNKQNEPAVAIDANHPNVVVAGANEEIDMEACNAGTDNTCPFTPGVGVSGVYFSFDSGHTWTQPTYTGLTARACLGVPGNSDPPCTPTVGPIGTLPWYYENGLQSGGDPAVAFGPQPDASGHFSWANGSRLYYANLAGHVPEEFGFRGVEALAVSRTDNVEAAAGGDKDAWMQPVIVSRQSSTTFSDKEQIWADNSSGSPFFGNTYVCWTSYRSNSQGQAFPAPMMVAVSRDGGDAWALKQVTGAGFTPVTRQEPAGGCTVRTDSSGRVYVFGVGPVPGQGSTSYELMVTSDNGGQTWSPPRAVSGPVTQPGAFDPVQGRPVIDGIAGARSDLAPAPSVDIANGAPTGAGATDRIVMAYVSGSLEQPHVFFTESTDRGATWSAPRSIETAGDRGYYAAPAIAPDGSAVYVTYNAFTTPFRTNTTDPRNLVGVLLRASVSGPATGAFTSVYRSPGGDPRGSSANALISEFLGDYVYAAATRTYAVAVFNDVRNAADCPAIDAYRAALQAGTTATAPAVQQVCPLAFGNSDIFSFTTAD